MKVNVGDDRMNGSEGRSAVETSTATESELPGSTDASTSNPATASTTKTTYDELMQVLTELEADDALPTPSCRGPTWREFITHSMHHFTFRLSLPLRLSLNLD